MSANLNIKMIIGAVLALLGVALLLVGFVLYKSIVGPYLQRRHFRQYSNVWVNPSPKFLLHDVADLQRRQQEQPNYSVFLYGSDRGLENPDKDFVLSQLGSIHILHISSLRATQEAMALIPSVLDRESAIGRSTFGRLKVVTSGYSSISNQSWKHTRESNSRAIQFNKSSQYVPLIYETARAYTSHWKSGDVLDMQKVHGSVTFGVIAKILFGKDLDLKRTYPYRCKDGKIK